MHERGERLPLVGMLLQGTLEHARSLLVASLSDRRATGELDDDASASAVDRVIQQDRVTVAVRTPNLQPGDGPVKFHVCPYRAAPLPLGEQTQSLVKEVQQITRVMMHIGHS